MRPDQELLLKRSCSWTLILALALAVLGTLISWVEASGARDPSEALTLALLRVPEQLVVMAPLVAALGGAVAALSLVRSSEWVGLAAAGASAQSRLLMLSGAGLITGILSLGISELVVPPASIAYHQASSQNVSSGESGIWLESGGYVIHAEHLDEGLRGITAWPVEPTLGEPIVVAELTWDGAWRGALGELLPPLGELLALQTDSLSARTIPMLIRDGSTRALAELWTRISRALSCWPASLLGAALLVRLGPRVLFTIIACSPVLAWELGGAILQASELYWAGAALKLLVAGALSVLALWPTGPSHRSQ